MTEESKPQKPKIENLELNKETVQELTDADAAQAKGGVRAAGSDACIPTYDQASCKNC